MFQDENVQEFLSGLIKIGEVSSVDEAKCTARVVFDDDDSVISYELPILQRNTLENKDYQTVHVGEDVLCVFLPNGQEEGFIIGSFYAGEVRPPASSKDTRTVVFSDGSKVTYDRSSHSLTVEIGGTTIVADRSRVAVASPDEIKNDSTTVTVTGSATVNINGGASVNITTPALNLNVGGTTMSLTGSSATITSSDLVLNGNIAVTGNLAVTGNINATGPVHGSNI